MKKAVFWLLLVVAPMVVASCGSDHPNPGVYRGAQINQLQQYPQLAQYGQYQMYNGQQYWVPNEQPPLSWIPGQSYYQQGSAYMPPYYNYLNQPQYWQYNQGLGWSYQIR